MQGVEPPGLDTVFPVHYWPGVRRPQQKRYIAQGRAFFTEIVKLAPPDRAAQVLLAKQALLVYECGAVHLQLDSRVLLVAHSPIVCWHFGLGCFVNHQMQLHSGGGA